jgi:hypothetical protein
LASLPADDICHTTRLAHGLQFDRVIADDGRSFWRLLP